MLCPGLRQRGKKEELPKMTLKAPFLSLLTLFLCFLIAIFLQGILGLVRLFPSKKKVNKILRDVTGILKPSRYISQIAKLVLPFISLVLTMVKITLIFQVHDISYFICLCICNSVSTGYDTDTGIGYSRGVCRMLVSVSMDSRHTIS